MPKKWGGSAPPLFKSGGAGAPPATMAPPPLVIQVFSVCVFNEKGLISVMFS
jgi:hypothetical protein